MRLISGTLETTISDVGLNFEARRKHYIIKYKSIWVPEVVPLTGVDTNIALCSYLVDLSRAPCAAATSMRESAGTSPAHSPSRSPVSNIPRPMPRMMSADAGSAHRRQDTGARNAGQALLVMARSTPAVCWIASLWPPSALLALWLPCDRRPPRRAECPGQPDP